MIGNGIGRLGRTFFVVPHGGDPGIFAAGDVRGETVADDGVLFPFYIVIFAEDRVEKLFFGLCDAQFG